MHSLSYTYIYHIYIYILYIYIYIYIYILLVSEDIIGPLLAAVLVLGQHFGHVPTGLAVLLIYFNLLI